MNKFPPQQDLVGSSYYEGMRSHSDVSASRLVLKSCIGHSSSANINNSIPTFQLGWYVPQSLSLKNLDLFVEYREKSTYYMQPLQEKWNEGFQTFKWDGARIANQNNIKLSDLIGVARSTSGKEIIPLIFFNTGQPGPVSTYEFVFVANLTVGAKFILMDTNDKELEMITRQNQIKNNPIIVKFDASHLSEGTYFLFVEYFTNSGGEVVSDEDAYEFYHKK